MTVRSPRADPSPRTGGRAAKAAGNGSGATLRDDTTIFGGYSELGSYGAAFDEMFDPQGRVRPPYKGIYTAGEFEFRIKMAFPVLKADSGDHIIQLMIRKKIYILITREADKS